MFEDQETSKSEIIQQVQYDDLDKLNSGIEQLQTQLFGFTEGMRMCVVTANASQSSEFVNLRNLIVHDSLIYFQYVAPITKKVFYNIQSSFELMQVDSVEEFVDNLQFYIEESDKLLQQVNLSKDLHLETLQTAQHRKIQAEKVVLKLKLDEQLQRDKYEVALKKQSHSMSKIKSFPDWYWVIPITGWLTAGICSITNSAYAREADKQHKLAISHMAQAQINSLAYSSVSDVICPALNQYIDNLKAITEILTLFQVKLMDIEKRCKTAKEKASAAKIVFKSVQKNLAGIVKGSIQMIAYYDICQSNFKVFGDQYSSSYLEEWMNDNIKDCPKQQKPLMQRIKEKLSINEHTIYVLKLDKFSLGDNIQFF